MKFIYAESMIDVEQYFPLAMEAERAGYHSFTVPDSICYPQTSDSKYPYTADGNREFLQGKPFIEPFSLIPALGAVTERLHFTTFVVKLAVRHPVLVAKQATSVACITKNRFEFGVGLSPWPDDFRIMNQQWERRGKRMDEMIEIVKGLSTGEFFGFKGEFYDLEPIQLCPVPTRPIPLLIGGHADAALRRAARIGDGWLHAGGGAAADLDSAIGRLAELRREYGRQNDAFEVQVISMDAYSVDGIKRLEDRGVTGVFVGFRNAYEADTTTLQQKLDALKGYADNVISKVS